MTFPFGSEFTVGIEEELFLVEEATLALSSVTDEVLDAMRVDPRAAGHDAYAAQIELRSPPGASVAEAVESLALLRGAANAAGATLLGAGLHPDGRFGDATLVEGPRYELVADQLRGLLRRTPESALHVHVGLPDERAAAQAFNAMRLQVPLLVGLAANSPFWFGTDSGLRSARYVLSRAYPGRSVPRAVRDIEDLEQLAAETLTISRPPRRDLSLVGPADAPAARHARAARDGRAVLARARRGDRRPRAGAGHRGRGRTGSPRRPE